MRRIILAIIILLLIGGTVLMTTQRDRPVVPDPPTPDELAIDDPVVQEFLSEGVEYVRRARFDPWRWVRLGMAYQANTFPEIGLKCYNVAIDLDDSNARYWFHRASVTHHLGHVSAALADIDRAIALNGTRPFLHWRKGLWLLEVGRTEDALLAFRRAVEFDPKDSTAGMALGRGLVQAGEFAEAIDVLRRIDDADANRKYISLLLGSALRGMGEIEQAKAALADGRGSKPDWSDEWTDEMLQHVLGFTADMKRAQRVASQGRYDEMINILSPWQKRRPNDVALLNNLGTAYTNAKRYDEAADILNHAIEINADHFAAYLNLATLYQRTGLMQQALQNANRSIELNPSLARAHETRGLILWQMNRTTEALDALDRAFALDARNVQILVWKANIYCQLEQWDKAQRLFEQVTDQAPNNVWGHIGMGLVLMERGLLDDAQHALNTAAEISPNDPQLADAKRKLQRLLTGETTR
jgi:tetratricopeptide (TPR) repeat protein